MCFLSGPSSVSLFYLWQTQQKKSTSHSHCEHTHVRTYNSAPRHQPENMMQKFLFSFLSFLCSRPSLSQFLSLRIRGWPKLSFIWCSSEILKLKRCEIFGRVGRTLPLNLNSNWDLIIVLVVEQLGIFRSDTFRQQTWIRARDLWRGKCFEFKSARAGFLGMWKEKLHQPWPYYLFPLKNGEALGNQTPDVCC